MSLWFLIIFPSRIYLWARKGNHWGTSLHEWLTFTLFSLTYRNGSRISCHCLSSTKPSNNKRRLQLENYCQAATFFIYCEANHYLDVGSFIINEILFIFVSLQFFPMESSPSCLHFFSYILLLIKFIFVAYYI